MGNMQRHLASGFPRDCLCALLTVLMVGCEAGHQGPPEKPRRDHPLTKMVRGCPCREPSSSLCWLPLWPRAQDDMFVRRFSRERGAGATPTATRFDVISLRCCGNEEQIPNQPPVCGSVHVCPRRTDIVHDFGHASAKAGFRITFSLGTGTYRNPPPPCPSNTLVSSFFSLWILAVFFFIGPTVCCVCCLIPGL